MKTIQIDIPEEVNEFEVKMRLATLLFDEGILSAGQAGQLVGISKRSFIEKVGLYNVSIFNDTVTDLRADVNL